MAELRLQGIEKRFGDAPPVLRGVSIDVYDGEFMVLAGPSGSGKTTLLRVVAGLERPDDGRVWIDGEEVTSVPAARRGLSMVFQEHALFPHRTAERNITFPLEIRNVDPKERHARAVEEASSLRIDYLLARYPRQLSAGHRQAVATARSLIRETKALLMDEPLAHLDAKARADSRVELARLHRELGVTVLYVTNDQTEALALADRVAVLDGGRLRQLDPPRRLYDRPVDRFVGEFIGTPPMRMVPGELSRRPGGADLVIGSDRLRLDPAFLEARPALLRWLDLPVTVGLRAEWLVDSGGAAPFDRCLHGTVAAVEDHGSEAMVDVDLGSGGLVTVRYAPGILPNVGDLVELAVELDKASFFDPANDRAIRRF